MRTIHRLLLLAFLFLPIGLMAQSITGTWEMTMPGENGEPVKFQAKISEDGTYTLDWMADGKIEAKGKYEISGNQVTIQDTEGSDCKGKGVYKYKIEGNTMTMTRVSDECPDRGGPEGVMKMTRA